MYTKLFDIKLFKLFLGSRESLNQKKEESKTGLKIRTEWLTRATLSILKTFSKTGLREGLPSASFSLDFLNIIINIV